MKDIFPFSEIEKGSRIVLYGASERGYDFYRQIVSTGYCSIAAWVDRQYEWYQYMGLPVESPRRLCSILFDVVVITAEKASIYFSMLSDLMKLNIPKERIFWKEDCGIRGNTAKRYDRERIRAEASGSIKMDPIFFLTESRLDLVVRYLYAKDILNRAKNTVYEDYYRRLMMSQHNGSEPTENMISAFFTEYEIKSGWKAFRDNFTNLVFSMRDNDFKREHFIPLDKKGRMINGAHRLSAALALEIHVWVRTYPFDGIDFSFDTNWFLKNGFTQDELYRILACREELLR